jgi:hypothetical protein
MKRIFYCFVVSFLFLFLSGCLTTLYPIFHEKDVVFDEHLLGYWKCADKSKETGFMEFRKIPDDRKAQLPPAIRLIADKGYLVSQINAGREIGSQYFVFLVKIGENRYLDYYPADKPSQQEVNRLYSDHYIKVHTNYRCHFKDNDHFEMNLFDQDFLDKLILDNQINIRHETNEGRNLITASTDDLQKFITKYGDNPDAYGGDVTYCSRIIDY